MEPRLNNATGLHTNLISRSFLAVLNHKDGSFILREADLWQKEVKLYKHCLVVYSTMDSIRTEIKLFSTAGQLVWHSRFNVISVRISFNSTSQYSEVHSIVSLQRNVRGDPKSGTLRMTVHNFDYIFVHFITHSGATCLCCKIDENRVNKCAQNEMALKYANFSGILKTCGVKCSGPGFGIILHSNTYTVIASNYISHEE